MINYILITFQIKSFKVQGNSFIEVFLSLVGTPERSSRFWNAITRVRATFHTVHKGVSHFLVLMKFLLSLIVPLRSLVCLTQFLLKRCKTTTLYCKCIPHLGFDRSYMVKNLSFLILLVFLAFFVIFVLGFLTLYNQKPQ